jgi:hypothetical protein
MCLEFEVFGGAPICNRGLLTLGSELEFEVVRPS